MSGVHVSPGSADTLASGGGITNHHLIAYSLSNISANTYQNRLMCVEVIVCHISVVFLDTVYINHLVLKVIAFPVFLDNLNLMTTDSDR